MMPKTLRIIHAGALQQALARCQERFLQANPGLRFETAGVGSREGAKRILAGEKYDIIALADQVLFGELLVPNFVKNYFVFAANQIVIGCQQSARGDNEITPENWADILLKPEVCFARSNHLLDPCGYRTLMVWQLAEKFYKRPGLYSALEAACLPYSLYPKSLDLPRALLERKVAYAFLYFSEVTQLGLPYVVLPPKINLSNPAYAEFYDQASVSIESKIPGTNMIIHGSPIEFAIGLVKDSSQPEIAQKFVEFVTGQEGSLILEECGLTPC